MQPDRSTWFYYHLCVLFQKQVTLNMFLDTFMSDHPPQCLVWLPLMHRLANVENGEGFVIFSGQSIWVIFVNINVYFNAITIPWVHEKLVNRIRELTLCFKAWLRFFPPPVPVVFHPVECSYCHSQSMMGFRYRCQQCHNYQLCQECFWKGHASGSHSNQHQMKEYTSWVKTR